MCIVERTLPDGRLATVYPLLGGRARLGVAPAGDRTGFTDVW
jgi:hypothetical protein